MAAGQEPRLCYIFCERVKISISGGAPVEVGLDHETRPATQTDPVDLQILEHAFHVIARLRKWDAFDPIDRIDLGIARITVARNPFPYASAPGIVPGEGQDIGAPVALEQVAKLRGA